MSLNRLRPYDFNDLTPPLKSLKSLSRSPERLRARPPVQLELSLPCVRRRRKRPGFEDFQRLGRLLRLLYFSRVLPRGEAHGGLFQQCRFLDQLFALVAASLR